MLSKLPLKVLTSDVDKQVLRIGIIAELDAINLYEQLASVCQDEKVKTVLLDIAKEEKTHVGEFEYLLKMFDDEHEAELEAGTAEVEDKI